MRADGLSITVAPSDIRPRQSVVRFVDPSVALTKLSLHGENRTVLYIERCLKSYRENSPRYLALWYKNQGASGTGRKPAFVCANCCSQNPKAMALF